ncbi:hypothetical protein SDC9_163299 [bioreactor metagenome]|uniref:Uncharacterized protein n=1 Tax=bioreactor metagenome TaxID=1076179 RepID=A0A645FV85_9ZZZZ
MLHVVGRFHRTGQRHHAVLGFHVDQHRAQVRVGRKRRLHLGSDGRIVQHRTGVAGGGLGSLACVLGSGFHFLLGFVGGGLGLFHGAVQLLSGSGLARFLVTGGQTGCQHHGQGHCCATHPGCTGFDGRSSCVLHGDVPLD